MSLLAWMELYLAVGLLVVLIADTDKDRMGWLACFIGVALWPIAVMIAIVKKVLRRVKK